MTMPTELKSSRRGFLKAAGALIIGFQMADKLAAQTSAGVLRETANNQVDSWISINQDETVVAYVGKCDFGQGFQTVQRQLVAEELNMPMERISMVSCDTGLCPDQGVSSGSMGHPHQFANNALRQALATARDALFQMAAKELNVAADQLMIDYGTIYSMADTQRRNGVSFGKLIGNKTFKLTLNATAKPKDPRDYKVLGQSIGRYDVPPKVTGEFQYVQNVRVPGMLHGKVVRPPMPGAKYVSHDAGSVTSLPGNVKVVVKNDFVGVVADKEWFAIQAADRLKVTWSQASALPAQADLYIWMRTLPTRDAYTVRTPDVDENLAKAAKVVKQTYLHPFQKHGSLGTSCAVADVKATTATIWCSSQGVYPQRDSVARVLNLTNTNIRVIYVEGSGCYGLNGNDAVAYDAAILSQGVGKPVRVQHTRASENIGAESFGPAFSMDLRAGLDANGNILVWDYEAWTFSKGGRPSAANPGNIVTGELAGFATPALVPAAGTNPTAFNNNGNNAAAYGAGVIGSTAFGTGTVRSERVLIHTVASPFFTGPLRSPNRLQNTFAHESFIEELAFEAKVDAVEYRLRHLSDERLIACVKGAAEAFGWTSRPPLVATNPRTGKVFGRGMSCCLYEGGNGYCAMAIEVEVDQATGVIGIVRMSIAGESGPISNPDGFANQLQGGALQGVGRALREEVTWNASGLTSTDWRKYKSYQFGDRIPEMDTVMIDRKDVPQMGAGESTITISAPAVANAVFDATGARLRQVPFTPERVLAALKART